MAARGLASSAPLTADWQIAALFQRGHSTNERSFPVPADRAEGARRELATLLEELPGHCNTVMGDAITDLERLDARIAEYDRHIALCAKNARLAWAVLRRGESFRLYGQTAA